MVGSAVRVWQGWGSRHGRWGTWWFVLGREGRRVVVVAGSKAKA